MASHEQLNLQNIVHQSGIFNRGSLKRRSIKEDMKEIKELTMMLMKQRQMEEADCISEKENVLEDDSDDQLPLSLIKRR